MPFHFTIEPEMKLLPLTVNVNELDPATAEEGLIPVNMGVGLTGTEIVNVIPALVPPPGVGLNTVTVALPAALIFVAGTTAVN